MIPSLMEVYLENWKENDASNLKDKQTMWDKREKQEELD